MNRKLSLISILLIAQSFAATAQITNIIELHQNDSSGRPASPFSEETPVTITGVVTCGTGVYSSSNFEIYVQDSTAGINIFKLGDIPVNVDLGDSVLITGAIYQYWGLTEIKDPTEITVLSKGHLPPEPLVLTCAEVANTFQADFSEPNESRLVRVNNCTYEKKDRYTGTLRDSTGECILYRDGEANLPEPSGVFDVIGILKQYDYDAPFDGGYEVSPRFVSDFVSRYGPIFLSQPIEIDISSNFVTFNWDTDTPATSLIRFGLSSDYELGAFGDSALVTHHIVKLTNLDPATIYRCQAISTNDTGASRSNDLVFCSGSSPDSRGIISPFFNKSVEHEYSSGTEAESGKSFSWLLNNQIDNVNYTIDVCIYSFSLEDVAMRLIAAKNRGIKVRVIYESENGQESWMAPVLRILRNSGIPMINDRAGSNDGNGAMHNKFIVFDHGDKSSAADDWVWTGSYNFTLSGTSKNAENVILIQDESLSACYTAEFNEMWGSEGEVPNPENSRFGNRKTNNTPHRFNIGGVWVEQYMSPSDNTESQIIKTIDSANFSTYFCILSFTRSSITSAMRSKWYNVDGFQLKGVFDSGSASGQYSQYPNFDGSGDQPWSPRPDVHLSNETGSLHHKYVLIDPTAPESNPVVVTGSHNWSSSANTKNDENTLIIHDEVIANQYLQEFAARYHKAGGSEDFVTGVFDSPAEKASFIEDDFVLYQNYPNPFNNSTVINLKLPVNRNNNEILYLKISDVLGRTVKTWQFLPSGDSDIKVSWNGTDNVGNTISSGVYVCKATLGNAIKNIKMLFLQ